MATTGYTDVNIRNFVGAKTYIRYSWTRTSYSIQDNTSTINWTLELRSNIGISGASRSANYELTVGGQTYRGNQYYGGTPTSVNSVLLASGSTVVRHGDKGEALFYYVFTVEAESETVSGSGTGVLDTIPVKATILSRPSFSDEDRPTITYTNPSGLAVQKLEIGISFDGGTFDDIAYREIPKIAANVTGSYTFSFTQEEREKFWQLINAKDYSINADGEQYVLVNYILKTTINGADYTTLGPAMFLVKNYLPTLSPTVKDTNTRTVALTGNSNIFIRYFSNATFTTGAKARKGASITNQYVQCGSVMRENEPTGTIEGVTSNTFYFGVADSREDITRSFLTRTLIPYVKLTNRLTTKPVTADGKLEFTITGKYYNGSFGAQKNELEVEFRLDDESGNPVFNANGSGWIPMGVINPEIGENDDYSFTYTIEGLNHEATYTLTVNAIDKLMPQAATAVKTVATVPLFDWGHDDFHFHIPVNICERLLINDEGQLHGTKRDGNTIQAIDSCNNNNNLVIGYGNYIEETVTPTGDLAGTNVYGNTVNFMHKNGMTINWTPFVDFVTEQGSKDNWFYRKWNSGRVELYGYQNVSNAACDTALGGMYRTAVINAPAFPFTVYSPKMVASYESEGYGAFIWHTTLTTNNKPANYYLVRPTSSSGITGKVNFHIQGSWK